MVEDPGYGPPFDQPAVARRRRHYFFRYLIRMQPDYNPKYITQGFKLCGMETASPMIGWQPHDFPTVAYISAHIGASQTNPEVYRLANYVYDLTCSAMHRFTGGFLEIGTKYCIEHEYYMNTFTPQVLQDGIHRVYLNGVLVYEKKDCWFRRIQEPIIAMIPFMHIYHGGIANMLGHLWYEIGAPCLALDYIGPPKIVA